MSVSDSGEPGDGWRLLRVKDNDSGPGTFADDTDWAGTNVLPPESELVYISAQNNTASSASTSLVVMMVAVDTSDDPVDKGTFTVAIQLVEKCRTSDNEDTFLGSSVPTFVADGASTASYTLNRRLLFNNLKPGAFTIRLHTFANIPATANEIRIYTKMG